MLIDFEVGCGKRIKSLCSDNGSEFKNKRIELLCLKEGIKQIFAAPRVPQQNGRIEREMRTIKEAARTMLITSKLREGVAHEALQAACYIRNRLATSKSTATPFERFTVRKPKVDHIRPFSEIVQILDTGHYLTTFAPRTIDGYLVGFTNRQNTYRIPIKETGKVLESCDVFIRPHLKADHVKIENKESDAWISYFYPRKTNENNGPINGSN